MEESQEPAKREASLKAYFRSSGIIKPLIYTIIGGAGGYLFYYFIGCSSGSCAITSNPYMSTFFGAAFGYFLLSSPCSRNKC